MYMTFDAGETVNDRYTVFPFRRHRNPDVRAMYLGFNGSPTSPNAGVSQWGELSRYTEPVACAGLGKRVPFKSLPDALQRHVIARVKQD